MRRIFFVPEEHEAAMKSLIKKLQQNGTRNGQVVFATPEEMEAVKHQAFIDIPDGEGNGE